MARWFHHWVSMARWFHHWVDCLLDETIRSVIFLAALAAITASAWAISSSKNSIVPCKPASAGRCASTRFFSALLKLDGSLLERIVKFFCRFFVDALNKFIGRALLQLHHTCQFCLKIYALQPCTFRIAFSPSCFSFCVMSSWRVHNDMDVGPNFRSNIHKLKRVAAALTKFLIHLKAIRFWSSD
jgi:hypothetical protein